jgi:hypothetical protein
MKRAELVMQSKLGDEFLTGICSICPSVCFRLEGNTWQQKELLRVVSRVAFSQSTHQEETIAG